MIKDPSIGVALIGYGYVGENFHAPLIDATDGLSLRVIASSHPEKVHARFPAMRVAPDPEEAIEDDAIELVVIASPNGTHVRLAATALAAGKHVVVDKPFTITTAEARRLETFAAEKQRLLSVFHNRRWDGDFLTLRQLVASGELGQINYFESHFDRFRPEVRERWREQPGPGAGLWYDLGPHLIDQALVLFGPPETVEAAILKQRVGASVDDYAHVVLGYGSGNPRHADHLQVVLHGSMLAPGGWPRFLVHGSKGSWRKDGLDAQEPQLLRGMRPGEPGWGIDASAGTLFEVGGDSAKVDNTGAARWPNLPGAYEHYYAGIRDAVRERAVNPVPPGEAVLVMAVLEAAIESAAAGERRLFSI